MIKEAKANWMAIKLLWVFIKPSAPIGVSPKIKQVIKADIKDSFFFNPLYFEKL